MSTRCIYVYADFYFLPEPRLMGRLFVENLRGKEVFSFEYEKQWLKDQPVPALDPDLLPCENKSLLSYTTNLITVLSLIIPCYSSLTLLPVYRPFLCMSSYLSGLWLRQKFILNSVSISNIFRKHPLCTIMLAI